MKDGERQIVRHSSVLLIVATVLALSCRGSEPPKSTESISDPRVDRQGSTVPDPDDDKFQDIPILARAQTVETPESGTRTSAPPWAASSIHDIGSRAPTIDSVAARHGLVVVRNNDPFAVETPHGTLTGSGAPEFALETYLPILAEEWNLYPVDVITKSRLRRIVLCSDLRFDGQPYGAHIDYSHLDLYLDVESAMHVPLFMRRAIHHEFYHLIDWKDDGEVYGDREWLELNVEDWRYGSGGKNMQDDPLASHVTESIPGFLNRYSTSGVEEDKAEIFSFLIVEASYVYERANNDRVIASKMRQMKRLMFSFSRSADDTFWEQARRLDRATKEGSHPAERAR